MNPTLTFSPDGTKMLFFTGSYKLYLVVLGALFLCVSLALVKLYEMIMAVVGFFLTASPESLMRLFFLLLVVIGTTCFFSYVVPSWKARSASC